MPGKIVYVAPVANTMDFLPYFLPYWYEIADRLILTEGVIRFCHDKGDEAGLSTDGTTEFIWNFPDPKNKIIYIPVGRCDLMCDLRNPYLELTEPGDILLQFDMDEIMSVRDVEASVQFLRSHPDCNVVLCDQLMFWGDFRHHLAGLAPVWRICRREADWRYAQIEYSDGKGLGDDLAGTTIVPGDLLPRPQMLHFGWVRKPRRLFEKVLVTYRFLGELKATSHPHLAAMSEADRKWDILFNHPCFCEQAVPQDWQIVEYAGELPEPVRQHPYYWHPEVLRDDAELRKLEAEIEAWI